MKEIKTKSVFAGGVKNFESTIKRWNMLKIPYRVVTSGTMSEIHYGGNVLRFVLGKVADGDKGVGMACKRVKEDATKFTKENGSLPFEKRTTFYLSNGLFNEFIMKGGEDIYMVDINSCYWSIVRNAGIISDKTFNALNDKKVLRLVAIGNLNKKTIVKKYTNGKEVSIEQFENPNSWVWDYVVYKAYEIFEQVNAYIDNRTMMYKTDCFFVKKEDVEKVQYKLKELGYSSSVEKRKVVGHKSRKAIFSTEDGELKISSFTLGNAVLDRFEYMELTYEQKISLHEQNQVEKELNEGNYLI
jgi:macrodomain Ter protein organizer (MatP/YcbG family)